MINSLNGPVLLNDAFGVLLAANLGFMLRYAEHPKVCGTKIEYGVPFYDDLDTTEKAIVLHRLITSFFDPEASVLKETAYHAATLAALENCIKDNVEREIDMRHWSKKTFGKENDLGRTLTIKAFKSRYPHDSCPSARSTDTTTFLKMIDRLYAEIRPKPYFLMADVPKTKRKIMMQRLAIPDDYFAPLEGKTKMPEKNRNEQCRALFREGWQQCSGMFNRYGSLNNFVLQPGDCPAEERG